MSADFYQNQYSYVARTIKQDLTTYHSAIESDDPQTIDQAASDLASEIDSDVTQFSTQRFFGCHDSALLNSFEDASGAFAGALWEIDHAARSTSGHTQGEIPSLVQNAKPQERVYIEALNAWSSQFGGEQIARS
jgi:hypothetical protein